MIVLKIPSRRPQYIIANTMYWDIFVRSQWSTLYKDYWSFETLGM